MTTSELMAKRAYHLAELAEVDRMLAAARLPQAEDEDLIPIGVAARRSGRTTQTLRNWCQTQDLGVRVRGRWQISSRRLAQFLRS